MNRILLIEDDKNIQELLKIHLGDINCNCTVAGNGESGLNEANNNKYDLIILDIMLPGIGGIEICKKLRNAGNRTPIIMLTSRSEESDKITGL